MGMRRLSLPILLLTATFWVAFSLSSCDHSPAETGKTAESNNTVIPDDQKPVMTFAESTHSFGTVEEGVEVVHEFEFTNTGKTDLLISNAIASCGCTVPDWPKEPIPPGGKGKIKASFNSEGRSGAQLKSITITANTKDKVEVVLKGDVRPKATEKS